MAKPRFVFNKKGKKIGVVLGVKEFKKLMDDLEELDDIRAYDDAKKSGGTPIPIEQVFRKIERARR